MGIEDFRQPPDLYKIIDGHKQKVNAETHAKTVKKLAEQLTKPQTMVGEVKSLFEQYALPDQSKNPNGFYTPEIPIQLELEDGTELPEDLLFISHVDADKNLFAIVNNSRHDSAFFSLPLFLFADDGKNATVYGHKFKPLTDTNELIKARAIIEGLKYSYRRIVRDRADEINLAKYLVADKNELVLEASMLFYLTGEDPFAQYFPIEVELCHPSDALEQAMHTFYSVYNERPTPTSPSPAVLHGAEVVVNDKHRPFDYCDMQCFGQLYRELTTFDSDDYLAAKIQQEIQANPQLN